MTSSQNVPILFQDPPSKRIVIHIKNLEHVPSFKNQKRGGIGRRKDGSTYPMSWTPRDVKLKKEAIIQSLKSQLNSLCQTIEGEISTAALQRFLMRYVPQDDCWQIIRQLQISVRQVDKGEEGAIITIERLCE